ncbi:MATE family efflux transporter [Aliikangiella coralliicola]|uniref:Multidrug-efflux transporter n=2 Tax=Aliikangiella coralliicola TaxID=2592383 RepID=A0A545UCM3_9GAMM|nr:MATE family efflux transporter [Aliikangiella coralliicola]
MSIPIGLGMVVQTLYYLVDLYFVGALGDVALAGVSAAGNLTFLVIALTQILNVGTVALISQAVGKKDKADANLVFNQSLLLSMLLGVITLIGGYLFAEPYLRTIAADEATVSAGKEYLFWFIPNLALQFALVAMGAALRGTGIVKPTMIVQMLSVLVNMILAPVLIAGWGTGKPMGVAGAGLASSIAALFAVVVLWFYFHKLEKYVYFDASKFLPQWQVWKKVLSIGLPAGGEFLLMFVYMGVIYWTIRDFGSAAQAGFGLGSRIMQSIFLPALAIAFAVPAVVGQNYGAQLADRVRETFKSAAIIIAMLMGGLSLLCIINPSIFLTPFTKEPEVILVASDFLRLIAFNFIPSGLIFVCSGVFQGVGNTWPALISTGTRLLTFAIPAIWVSRQVGFEIEEIWYLSIVTVIFQMVFSLVLVRRELNRRLVF